MKKILLSLLILITFADAVCDPKDFNCEPSYIQGTSFQAGKPFTKAQKKRLEKGLIGTKKALKKAIKVLKRYNKKDKRNFVKYYGTTNKNIILKNLKKMLKDVNQFKVNQFISVYSPKSNKFYGSTNKGAKSIKISQRLWKLSSTYDFARLAHEFSHLSWGSKDIGPYGLKNVKYLAKNKPAKAAKNADTVRYFLQSL